MNTRITKNISTSSQQNNQQTPVRSNFIYSKEMEALRVIETLYQMKNGFYNANGFYVLPYRGTTKKNSSIVYLPDTKFLKIPHLWDKLKKIEYWHLPIKASSDFCTEVQELIEEKYPGEIKKTKLEDNWESLKSSFFPNLLNVLSIDNTKDISVQIFVSRFGPRVSFNFVQNSVSNSNYEIKLYIRQDAGVQDLLYGIISSLTREEVLGAMSADWEAAQFLSDWLLHKSYLSEGIEEYLDLSQSYSNSLKNKQLG